ncbi:serine hydroxymethyltransferase [Streptomyces sp. DSM 41527]|uniref:Serine hydroxymethyltransferase n=1 Tax=Streptomyces mooreae TaxID=3075523 RepID=A0ABU2T8U5_9ACTN|nr:serine hydroxymethyltransferase [Streptomyces sp. DSM 41527]MDT0457356.1 serine hydroxymethyltransferase [Streptomyces sp. DSM 41527]
MPSHPSTRRRGAPPLTENLPDPSCADADPEVAAALAAELRQRQGSLAMTAAGQRPLPVPPEHAALERLADGRAKALFDATFAHVLPATEVPAHQLALLALLAPHDTVLCLDHPFGGHGVRSALAAVPGRPYDVVPYGLRTSDGQVDMAEVARLARAHLPAVIVVGGAVHPRIPDLAHFRQLADEVGALLMVDMTCFAGPVAAGLRPSPVSRAHVVTADLHETLDGAGGGVLLTDDRHLATRLASIAAAHRRGGLPGQLLAAQAVALRGATSAAFRDRQERALRGARILAGRLLADDVAETGARVVTGSTETPLVLIDLAHSVPAAGRAGERLRSLGIRPHTTGEHGLCLGTTALAGRGFDDASFRAVADVIARALPPEPHVVTLDELGARVAALTNRHPIAVSAEASRATQAP